MRLSGATESTLFAGKRNKERSTEPRVGLVSGTRTLSKFRFADMTSQAGVTPSWAYKLISTLGFMFRSIVHLN